MAIFIDLNKAFDRLDYFTLIKKLQELNITRNIYRYIHSFLSNRTATIKIKNKLNDKFNIYAGSPQGSIILPTLFLLLVHDIPLLMQKNLFISLFADDVAIWCVDDTIDLIINILQPYIDIVATYFTSNKLIISQDKTIGVIFSKLFPNYYTPPRLLVKSQLIEIKDKVRFLGFLFDKKLSFKGHATHLAGKCNTYINIMKFLTGTTFGCNFKTLRTIYKALILSTLNYGCVAYHTLSSTVEKQLKTIQTRALRICLGALQSTPNIVTIVESSEIPLTLQRLQRLLFIHQKFMLQRTTYHKI